MLINLPLDVTMKFTGYLGMQDLYNWSFTCKNLFAAIHDNPMVIERKRQHFIQLFGTLTPYEAHFSLDTLINRIHKGHRLTLTEDKSWMLKFSAQGVPRLEEMKKGVEVPTFNETATHLEAFVQDTTKVLKDLLQQPKDPKHPIHDYRNRLVRIIFLQKQIMNFYQVMHVEYSRNIRAGISWNERVMNLWAELQSLKTIVKPEVCLDHKQFVMDLGSTTILVNGQTMPIKIQAKPKASETQLCISLLDGNRKECGRMQIYRAWYENKKASSNASKAILEEEELLFSDSNPKYLLLHVKNVNAASLVNAKTGDRPLLRLITQVAVEIFARDPAQGLTINSVYDHADVYAFMGLGGDKDFRNVKARVLEYRAFSGRWFPAPEDQGAYFLSMHKLDYSKEHQTQYFKIMNKNKGSEPAWVEYNPNETLTWEQYIERQPVLNAFTEPLFWPKW